MRWVEMKGKRKAKKRKEVNGYGTRYCTLYTRGSIGEELEEIPI